MRRARPEDFERATTKIGPVYASGGWPLEIPASILGLYIVLSPLLVPLVLVLWWLS